MTSLLWILGLIAALVVTVFSVQNADPVPLRFLGWFGTVRLPVVIFFAAVLGALVTGLLGGVSVLRLRRRLRHAEAEIESWRAGRGDPSPGGGAGSAALPAQRPSQPDDGVTLPGPPTGV